MYITRAFSRPLIIRQVRPRTKVRACSPTELSPDFFATFTQFMCHHDLSCLHVPIPPIEEQEMIVQQFRAVMATNNITEVEKVVLTMLLNHEYEELEQFLMILQMYHDLHTTIASYVENVATM